jgi:hypothetical protein
MKKFGLFLVNYAGKECLLVAAPSSTSGSNDFSFVIGYFEVTNQPQSLSDIQEFKVLAQSSTSVNTLELCTPLTLLGAHISTVSNMDFSVAVIKSKGCVIERNLYEWFNAPIFLSNDVAAYMLADTFLTDRTLKDVLLDFATFKDVNTVEAQHYNSLRKYASKYKAVDWDIFWNSNLLSDTEKDYCKTKLNLQIAYNNSKRPVREYIRTQFYTDYESRKYVDTIMTGVPGSGKTSMILNDICPIDNIPVIYWTADVREAFTKHIIQVTPEGIPQQDGTVKVELMKVITIFCKCLMNSIPLLVFVDEVNNAASLDNKSFATLISEGKIMVGTTFVHDKERAVKYVCAYNPGSIGEQEFPESFLDRRLLVQVDKTPQEEMIAFRRGLKIARFIGIENQMNLIESVKETYPSLAPILDRVDVNTVTRENLDWLAETYGNKKTPVPVTGKYVPHFDTDVTVAFDSKIDELITKYFDLVNQQLRQITQGQVTNVKNRGYAIQIPDRCYDVFVSTIFNFSSVEEATKFTVINNVDRGNVVKVGTSSEDNAPETIWKTIQTNLSAEIESLQKYLFSGFDTTVFNNDLFDVCQKVSYVYEEPEVEDDEDISVSVDISESSASPSGSPAPASVNADDDEEGTAFKPSSTISTLKARGFKIK